MLSAAKIRFLAFSLVFVFTIASMAAAQGANSLQGRVSSPDGIQPTTSVRVRLTFNGRLIQETFTDLSGRFYFTGLARGTYQITAEGDSRTFETTSVYAELSGSGGQLFTQDIQLRPLPGKPPAQTGVVDAFIQNVPKAARQALDRATQLTQQSKTEAAIEQLQEAIKIFPEYFEAHLQLGNIFLKGSLFDQAIAELDKARQVNPNDERAYQSFGLLLMKQKNYAVAVAVFAEAARLNPNNPMNALMRGTALIHQASTLSEAEAVDRAYLLERAELALSQAARLSGDKLKVDSLTLASFYDMKGEPGRAADELESYLSKSDAKNADPIRNQIKRLRLKAREAKPQPQ
jgi:tetratricopeptide (TPR) repeat protein